MVGAKRHVGAKLLAHGWRRHCPWLVSGTRHPRGTRQSGFYQNLLKSP